MAGEDTAGTGGDGFDAFGAAPDPVAVPDPGQGSTESEGSIFDPYLQTVPEEHRAAVGGYLKDAEKNVNQRLSDAADLQKQFGDYKDIDLSNVDPQQLSSVVAFMQDIGGDPAKYQEWVRSEATELGLIQPEQEQTGDDGENLDLEQYVQSRIEQALNPVTQKLSQFEQSNQEQKQADNERAIEQHIESVFTKIETDNKIKLSDEQQEAILLLAESVDGDDFIEQGFAKLRALEGGAQAGLVKDKTSQPAPALRTGGQPAPAKGKTFADVREQALEIINQTL